MPTYYIYIMTSKVQKWQQPRSPENEVAIAQLFKKDEENGGNFHTFSKEEIAEVQPKNTARQQK